MKKLLLLIAALLVAAPASFAQQKGRIDVAGIRKKIEKNDLDIQDPKKNQKGPVWLERGDVFLEAAEAPTKGLARSLNLQQVRDLDHTLPDPVQLPSLTRGETTYEVYEFDRFILYFVNGNLSMWTDNKVVIDPEAFEKSAKAYSAAYVLDGASMKKATEGLRKIVNNVKNRASTYLSLLEYEKAANEYLRSYEIQQVVPLQLTDTLDLFYAGMAYVVAEDYDKALEPLKKVMDMGYMKNGDVPYYLYYAYMGQDQKEEARKVLMEGLKQFPDLEKLYDPLPAMFVALPDADINEMIPYVEKVLAKNPDNVTYLFGTAQAYAARNQTEKALEYYKRASDVAPNEFSYAYNTGLIILQQSDAKMSKLKDLQDSMSNEEVEKQLEEILDDYAKALPYLQRAEAANPNNLAPVELIRNVSMMLRDRNDEYKAMHDTYVQKAKDMGSLTE